MGLQRRVFLQRKARKLITSNSVFAEASKDIAFAKPASRACWRVLHTEILKGENSERRAQPDQLLTC